MVPKLKSDDAGSSDVPKRNYQVHLVQILNKERKKLYVEITKIYGKNELSSFEIVKKEKEIGVSFAVTLQTADLDLQILGW